MIEVKGTPHGGATIVLASREDVAEFYSALVAAQVKGVAESDVVPALLEILSEP